MKLRMGVGVLLFAFCVAAGATDRKYIVKPRASDMKALPFSDAVLVGNTLYIAGHIGLDPKTGTPPAGAEEEARMVMDGIKQTVELPGSPSTTWFRSRFSAPT
jgi:enamine deaminase RidA (YjgF/YER057c/UK114 family)